jgi:hypothetical protein
MPLIWKLLALLAVLLMPLGMQPAVAAPARHHAALPMQHCPEQTPGHDVKGGLAECTMACSAALPAADLASEQPGLLPCVPTEAAAAAVLHGRHPDPATPPPRLS